MIERTPEASFSVCKRILVDLGIAKGSFAAGSFLALLYYSDKNKDIAFALFDFLSKLSGRNYTTASYFPSGDRSRGDEERRVYALPGRTVFLLLDMNSFEWIITTRDQFFVDR